MYIHANNDEPTHIITLIISLVLSSQTCIFIHNKIELYCEGKKKLKKKYKKKKIRLLASLKKQTAPIFKLLSQSAYFTL